MYDFLLLMTEPDPVFDSYLQCNGHSPKHQANSLNSDAQVTPEGIFYNIINYICIELFAHSILK